jgi:hypothetical protein
MSPKIALRSDVTLVFQIYAREAEQTLESAVNDALSEWMNEKGRYVCAELVKRRKAKTATTGRSLVLVKGNNATAS